MAGKRRSSPSSKPSKLAMDELARRGWRAQVVEYWVRKAGRPTTRDLFGFLDIVALDGKGGVLGLQVTSKPNMAARVRKIREDCAEAAVDWLRCGNGIEVWGYGDVAGRVVLSTRRLTLGAHGCIVIAAPAADRLGRFGGREVG